MLVMSPADSTKEAAHSERVNANTFPSQGKERVGRNLLESASVNTFSMRSVCLWCALVFCTSSLFWSWSLNFESRVSPSTLLEDVEASSCFFARFCEDNASSSLDRLDPPPAAAAVAAAELLLLLLFPPPPAVRGFKVREVGR